MEECSEIAMRACDKMDMYSDSPQTQVQSSIYHDNAFFPGLNVCENGNPTAGRPYSSHWRSEQWEHDVRQQCVLQLQDPR